MIRRIAVLLTGLLAVITIAGAAATPPYGVEALPRIGPYLGGRMPEVGPGISGNWSAVVAFPNLTFKNMMGLCPLPGTSRLIVWEREGRIWSFENRADTAEKSLVLDLSSRCQGWDDCGLLGLAFHPDFAKNHFVFIWYTWVEPGTSEGDANHRPRLQTPNRNRLSRFTLDNRGVAIADSELVLIEQETHTLWHKGGGMFFHPGSGFLYLTVGEDADGPEAQRVDHQLLGGILRIDVDERGKGISHAIPRQPAGGRTSHYMIPDGNPFVGRPGVLEEFYALGLRSPHRMTFDAPSNRIFIGDVGGGEREELDVIEPSDPPGLNFQWPLIEGRSGDLKPPYIGVSKPPILDYNHGEGTAIIAGYVYHGKRWAHDLQNRFIFGDNGNGKIWVLDDHARPPTKTQLCAMPPGPGPNSGSNYTGLSSFGLDADGELYLCQMSSDAGRIYRLERNGPPPVRKPFPPLLSQTGAFADAAKLAIAPGFLAYDVNAPLWSDGAVKSRWMALPDGQKIRFSEKGNWQFPRGTVFVKHFELPIDARDPAKKRRLETRLLVCDSSGSVYGVTYKWRPDGSDADLLNDSLSEDIVVHDAQGVEHTQTWYYPSQTDCLRCHTAEAGYVLGPKTRQLNGMFRYTENGVTDNQFRTWNHLQLFDKLIDESRIATFEKLVAITDTAAPLEERVRSYLDSNCSHCHRPRGVNALWDGRYATPLANANIIQGTPLNQLNIPDAKLIRPHDADRSVLFARMKSLDPVIRMPPLARNVVDAEVAKVMSRWIAEMPLIGAVPGPWRTTDVGAVGQAGDTVFLNKTFTVTGAGADIWERADGFRYVYQPLHGDGEIVAEVALIGEADTWAKAGVMIRASTAADAVHASMLLTRDRGPAFQRRIATGERSDHTGGPAMLADWIKLERRGDVFTASISDDGAKWTRVGEATIAMGPDVLIGLAVTSHNPAALWTAMFDRVAVRVTGQSK